MTAPIRLSDAAPAADAPVLFDAILHPHRSLGPAGFAWLIGAFGAVGLVVGGIFFASGAWPVLGLYGVDVALVYWAFRVNYRDARVYEKLRLTRAALTVERGDARGSLATWTFQPYWLTVAVDATPAGVSPVTLTSHGRSLAVGAFLSPAERVDFADALRVALSHVRRPCAAGPAPVEQGG
ncbi:MAG: DUF2244 domain-containing protein [Inquilinus sp.]|nr:DUF2244 domain-containing protein [Inquilinus sp.]